MLMDQPWCWNKKSGFLEAEIYLDKKQFGAYFKGGVVEWYDPEDIKNFRCAGMDPSTFPQRNPFVKGEIPFKFKSPATFAAMEGFARAFRAGRVDGLPELLIQVRLNESDALDHFMEEELHLYKDANTLAFTKTVNGTSYPTGAAIFLARVPWFSQLAQKPLQNTSINTTAGSEQVITLARFSRFLQPQAAKLDFARRLKRRSRGTYRAERR